MLWMLWIFAGIDKLIKHDVYVSAYPLHEVNLFSFILHSVMLDYKGGSRVDLLTNLTTVMMMMMMFTFLSCC